MKINMIGRTGLRSVTLQSPAGAAGAIHGSTRTDRGAKAVSNAGRGGAGGGGKIARSATPSEGSRFAHFAGAYEAAAAPVRAKQPAPISAAHGLRLAAMRRELINGAPSAKTERPPSGSDAVALARRLGVIK